MTSDKTRRYLRYLDAERASARMYRVLATLTDGERREALLELASIEDRHAAHWMALLHSAGEVIPADPGELSADDEAVVARARQMGLSAVLGDLERAEREGAGMYDAEPDALPAMSADEREHAEILAGLSVGPTSVPADARAVLNKAEPWHRTDKSGALRAAIFGVSDGLVSNTALVMGFAGSGVGGGTVLFAGLAGLLAGAFSMAAGEYVSVASQTDLFRRELAIEARELQEKPEEEQRELELLYRAKGLDAQTARTTAAKIMADPETALDTLAREELGLDPDDLGDPKRVAASSFAAFAVGAAVPVIPYVFLTGTAALTLAVTLAVLALIVVGGTVGRLSGLGVVRSALRQVLVGGGAAAITYVLGRLVGTGLG
ncbi:MAG: VIT1/CCC1 transporter family protein [Candidatus Nanopelagicales bacterium]|jgi:VIT1/CCC1 family predicted Fe2+/Mn2+ transporter|nr:VIT1/CCC1 transporter family protein [Candidatus Nanopelagicales bacterium]MCU0295605.1 VIT1/CCC1 transporter family protein [Candidatus Nanopelagicales bacterium]MCU0297609.1 VIT1/CCC1 transporter family protein [Candidatus Nanopelagicales bacterium]